MDGAADLVERDDGRDLPTAWRSAGSVAPARFWLLSTPFPFASLGVLTRWPLTPCFSFLPQRR